MKVELTFDKLLDRVFVNSLTELVNHKTDDFVTAYRLKKTLDKVTSESKRASKMWAEQYKKYELVNSDPANPNSPKRPKDEELVEADYQKFLQNKCEMDNCIQVHINNLIGFKLSALDLTSLEGVICGFEELEKVEEGSQNGQAN